MSRLHWVFAFVVLAVALCAGWMPVPAHAAAAPRTALVAETGPDALLSADTGGLRMLPAPRALACGQGFTLAAPRPQAPLAPPSPVRSAHRVDGLSLPLLR